MFKPGKSGNPKGKAKGTLHKATRAALALLEGDLEAITEKLVEKAKEGDLMAVKLILDKLIPNARERRLSIKLPQVEGAANLPAVLEAVASGDLTPGEGQTITAMLETYRKSVELNEIEARLKALEGKK
ncbi:MAG: DUF5681 domain-containing protein [Desulfobaccales bacterium]